MSVNRSPQNHADDRRVVASKGHGAKSEAVRERAVAALLGERSIARAAKRSGLNEGTLRRWLTEDEAFKTAYANARRTIFKESMDRIQIVSARAVETLEDLLSATKQPSVRLGAARTIVELGLHQQDADTILRKLQEFEELQREERTGASFTRCR